LGSSGVSNKTSQQADVQKAHIQNKKRPKPAAVPEDTRWAKNLDFVLSFICSAL
jgi:hypothetical protein